MNADGVAPELLGPHATPSACATVAELAIEAFFPADERTAAALSELWTLPGG